MSLRQGPARVQGLARAGPAPGAWRRLGADLDVATEEILLLRQVSRLVLAGSPRRIRSNFSNGLKSLPVRVEPVL